MADALINATPRVAAVAVSTANIQRLNGNNFLPWKRQVTILLKLRGLAKAIEEVDNGERVDEMVDMQAVLILLETMDDSHKIQVQAEETALAIMKALERQYANNSISNKFRMLSNYFKYSKLPGDTVSQHIGKMKEMRAALANLKEVHSDDMFQVVLIQSLPSEFGDIMRIWETTHPTLKTLELLYNLIQQREEELNKDGGMAQALVAKGGKNFSGLSIEEQKKRSRCGICKTKGHWWRDCPNKDKDQRDSSQGLKANILFNVASIGVKYKDVWVADSGASGHMSNNRQWFKEMRPPQPGRTSIEVGNGQKVPIKGVGTIDIVSTIDGKQVVFSLKDTMYIPDLSTNLLSIGIATKGGLTATFTQSDFTLSNGKQKLVTGKKIAEELYLMNARAMRDTQVALVAKEERTFKDWHETFGHPSDKRIKELVSDSSLELGILDKGAETGCSGCPAGKGARSSHPSKTQPKAAKTGEKFHVDLSGQVKNKESLYGYQYYLLGKDEATEFTFIEFVKAKHETPAALAKIFMDFEHGSGHRVSTMMSDEGSEFINQRVEMLLRQERIRSVTSAPYTPKENGLIEREMRTITEAARTMLLASGLPEKLWPLAVMQAVFLKNRLPTKRSRLTPFERFTGRKPYLKHLAKFGEPVQISDTAHYLYKFSARTVPAFIVGHTEGRNKYLVYLPETKHVRESCDVFFKPHLETVKVIGETRKLESVRVEWTPVIANSGNIDGDVNIITMFNDLSSSDRCRISTPKPTEGSKKVVIGADLDEFFRRYREEDYDNRDQDTSGEAGIETEDDEAKDSASRSSDEDTTIRPSNETNQDTLPEPTIVTVPLNTGGEQVVSETGRDPEAGADSVEVAAPDSVEEAVPKSVEEAALDNVEERATEAARLGVIVSQQETIRGEHNYGKVLVALGIASDEPKDYQAATLGPNNREWVEAIKAELEAHEINQTWETVPRPKTALSLSTKWVFTLKRNHVGEVERYKARLVARGFQQREGIDYGETFAPVAKTDSLRSLLAMSVIEGWYTAQFDVSTAFLNGTVEEEIFIEPPEGVSVPQDKCLRLKKALYGLKQAPRCWNSELDRALKELGFIPMISDTCVYINIETGVRIVIYVDDGLVFGPDERACKQLIEQLNDRFLVKRLSGHQFLGIQIEKLPDGLRLSQERYAKEVIERFDMMAANAVSTPLIDTRPLMALGDDERTEAPYRSAVGCLQYLACCTRPDLLFAVNFLAKFNSCPERKHWVAVKRVLQYLKGSVDKGIVYTRASGRSVHAYSDADWANDTTDRHSISGTLVLCAGGPIIFSSRRQSVVAQSTTESEYIAANEVAKELAAFVEFASEVKVTIERPTLFIDNQSAVAQIKNLDTKRRSKHIEVKYHYIRQKHQEGAFVVRHIETEDQLADYLTKPLNGPRLTRLTSMSGLKAGRSERKERNNIGPSGKAAIILLALLAVGTAVDGIEENLFGRPIDPLQWTLAEEYRVELGVRLQTVNLLRFPTCNRGMISGYHTTNNMTADAAARFLNRCRATYTQKTLKNFLELGECLKNKRPSRVKRELILLTILIITAITGLGYALYEGYNAGQQIEDLTTVQGQLKQDIRTLRDSNDLKASEVQLNQTLYLLNKLHNMTVDNEEALRSLAGLSANWAWDGGELNTIIEKDSEAFKELTRSCRKGRVNMDALRRFIDDPDLEFVEEDDTKLEEVKLNRRTNDSVALLFSMIMAARDTQIYRALPFVHYVNVMTEPMAMKYHGPRWMMRNVTANCTRGIDEPMRRAVHMRCDTPNQHDERFNDWRPAQGTAEEIRKMATPVVHRVGNSNLIYCMYTKISVGNQTVRCIDKPFALPIGLPFQLPNYEHKVNTSILNGIEGEPLETPREVGPRYISSDHERFMAMLHNVAEHNEKTGMLAIDRGTLTVPLNNHWLWIGLAASLGLITMMIVTIVICLKRSSASAPTAPIINVSSHHEHNTHYATPMIQNVSTRGRHNTYEVPPAYDNTVIIE